jgi:hypothetical protein
MTKYQKYSETFRFKFVNQYLNQKSKISLNSFAKTISGMDNKNEIIKGSVNESTFRGWIKKHETYDCEDIFNLLSNKTNNKIKISKKKLKFIKKLTYLHNSLPADNYVINNICENISNTNENNRCTINKKKEKRMTYTYTFKKKWVSIYKSNLQINPSLQLTYFTKLICGLDECNIINKNSINESTFRGWIKM